MNQNRIPFLAIVLFLAVVGCIKLPDIEPDEPEVPDVEEPLPDLGVKLLTPAATTYTNGPVDVTVEVTNGTAEAVDLFAGDELLATLTSPYTFRWDTTSKPEGTHTLKAKARRGSQTFTSEAREVVVDRTPPQVVSRGPSPGAQDVSVGQPIQASFSEVVDRNTLTAESVGLTVGQTQVPCRLEVSSDGRNLAVLPVTDLTVPASVSLALSRGIKDLAGNSLELPADAWFWRLPGFIAVGTGPLASDGAGSYVEDYSLAVSKTGELLAAWNILDINGPTTALIHVRHWRNGAWEPVGGGVSAGPDYPFATGFSVAFDSEGRPVLAWVGSRSNWTDSKIFVRRWIGNSWESIGTALSANAGNVSIGAPSLVIDSGNNPVVAWTEVSPRGSAEPANNYLQRWTGSAWEPLGASVSANAGKTSTQAASLALDAGRPVIAWAEAASEEAYSSNDPYVWRWDGTSWQPIGGLLRGTPGDTTSLYAFRIGVDPLGRILAAWSEYEKPAAADSISSVYAYRWEGGQGWMPLGGPLNAVIGKKSAREIDLALQPDGTPVLAWAETDLLGTSNIYVKRWVDQSWYSLDDALSALPGKTDASAPVVRIDSDGYPLIMWKESNGGAAEAIYVYRYNR